MSNKVVKKRESNFELLRIISMLGIIIYHLMLHHTDFTRFSFVNEHRFSSYQDLEIIQIFFTFGQISNTLFILITGYFLISKEKIDVVKPGIKLLSRAYSVVILTLIFSFLFNKYDLSIFSHSDINMLLHGWWFVGYYIFIIIFAKIYLNSYLKKLKQKSYLHVILILLVLSNFMLVFNFLSNLKIDSFVLGILAYSIGGYIRLYNPLKDVKLMTLLLILISFFVLLIIQYKVNMNNNLQKFYVEKLTQPDLFTVNSPFANILWSPSAIFLIASIIVFELFRRIQIGSIKIINDISAAVFTIYLFHESHFFRGLRFRSISLPRQLNILSEPIEQGVGLNSLDTPEKWLTLKEFFNISQVIQDKGLKVGVLYILFLTCLIFVIGLILEGLIIVTNKLITLIFYKEYEKVFKIT